MITGHIADLDHDPIMKKIIDVDQGCQTYGPWRI